MRGRKSLLALVLTASVAIPAGVAGQGVPVGDLKKIALEVLGLREEAAKTKAEQDKNEERLKQAEARTDQLAAAQETLDLLTETSRFVPDLEGAGVSGGVGAFVGAAEIYAIEDNNPYAARIMGDAPVTIEQMIAETAQRHAGHPALARAGINAVEFRCWLQALVKQESNFSIGARSHVGAFGLTQIMPGTFAELGIPDDGSRQDPRKQLDGGARRRRPRDACSRLSPQEARMTAVPGLSRIHQIALPVHDTSRAVAFYRDVLGFEEQARMGDQAAFLSAGGYHHHIGLNTWQSRGGPPPAPGTSSATRRWRCRAA